MMMPQWSLSITLTGATHLSKVKGRDCQLQDSKSVSVTLRKCEGVPFVAQWVKDLMLAL